MKLRNLREQRTIDTNDLLLEEPTNAVSVDGQAPGFTSDADASGPNAGLDTPMGYGTGKKKNGKCYNAEEKKAIKQMMGESELTFEAFRSAKHVINEWYTDGGYRIKFIDVDGKEKMYVVKRAVRNGKDATKVLPNKIENAHGHDYNVENDGEVCSNCGKIKCGCNEKKHSLNKKLQYQRNIVDESVDMQALIESGGKAIDQLQTAAESGSKVVITHEDGTRSIVDSITAKAIVEVYNELDASNRVKFINNANGSSRTFKEIASFAKNR